MIAEFWADGPESETPPGHWNTLANYVTDHPLLERRIGGEGPVLDPLEWDVKLYLALNGAVHDAAVCAWGLKGHYDYVRPITAIRHMAGLGQSSDPELPSYDPHGLPLEPGVAELITAESAAPGERHAHLAEHVGEIAVYSWLGKPEESVRSLRDLEDDESRHPSITRRPAFSGKGTDYTAWTGSSASTGSPTSATPSSPRRSPATSRGTAPSAARRRR